MVFLNSIQTRGMYTIFDENLFLKVSKTKMFVTMLESGLTYDLLKP